MIKSKSSAKITSINHHKSDADFMQLVLSLAEKGRYTVSPNPMVACILVKDGQIIAQGFHQFAGKEHAEIIALNKAGANAAGATAYVNLEPCCHFGRTPPCVAALIKAQVKKVVIACEDPNPLVAGQGITALQAAGIEIQSNICSNEAIQLNEKFFHYIKTQRPYIIAKWAMSLDGKTITHQNDSRVISDKTSQQHSHELRRECDAILIGASTAIKDNPLLTVRTQDEQSLQPIRIILSSDGNLPNHLTLLQASHPGKTIIATTKNFNNRELLKLTHVEILFVNESENGKVDLYHLLSLLAKKEITSILVEGGRTVHEDFFAKKLVNKTQVYLAPVIIGSHEIKQPLHTMQITPLLNDIFISAYNKELTDV